MSRPYDAFMAHMKRAADEEASLAAYFQRSKGELAHNATSNVLYGLLSNPRGGGPVSVMGASAGGVIDGLLFKPMVDATAHAIGKGLALVDRNRSPKPDAL